MVYLERVRPISLLATGEKVSAVTYVVDRAHRQYGGVLDLRTLVELVRQGSGISGHCRDYVLNTAAHLRDMKIHDHRLEQLVKELQT